MFLVDYLLKVVIVLYGLAWAATTTTNLLGIREVQGKKYFVGDFAKVTQDFAIELCNHYDMDLVSIEDEVKRQIVTNLTKSYENYWTSGNKLNDQETWIWANGVPMIYARWGKGQPDNKNRNEWCVSILDGHLKDENCNNEYFYVCESINTSNQNNVPPPHQQSQTSRCSGSDPMVNVIVHTRGNVGDVSYNITSTNFNSQGNGLTSMSPQKCTCV